MVLMGGGSLQWGGTSRVTGDCHARFCERLGVKFPGATRRSRDRERQVPVGPVKSQQVFVLRIAYDDERSATRGGMATGCEPLLVRP